MLDTILIYLYSRKPFGFQVFEIKFIAIHFICFSARKAREFNTQRNINENYSEVISKWLKLKHAKTQWYLIANIHKQITTRYYSIMLIPKTCYGHRLKDAHVEMVAENAMYCIKLNAWSVRRVFTYPKP